MHCKHDVKAFSKHRPKHRGAMFLSKHRLTLASLRIGKHCISKKRKPRSPLGGCSKKNYPFYETVVTVVGNEVQYTMQLEQWELCH